MKAFATLLWCAACCLALSGCSSSDDKKAAAPAEVKVTPVPDLFHVRLDTSKGPVDIEVHKDWAPRGADRFYQLTKGGFFDGARFFRVVRGFVVQFGISGDPQINVLWANAMLLDDPVKQPNVKGTVTFAKRGPNTRTTQLFINLADNRSTLDAQGFAPIGKVVDGMSVVESFHSYGDMPPVGQGPDPGKIQQQGNDYLDAHFPRLDFIKKAVIQ